ncbi:MAG: hypothetical protein KC777_23190 [Cyanobacteria bacterium HKST-UBA02]|nr:hypothetical protein [Cyanobacteria bacterium HKST-UBA02]
MGLESGHGGHTFKVTDSALPAHHGDASAHLSRFVSGISVSDHAPAVHTGRTAGDASSVTITPLAELSTNTGGDGRDTAPKAATPDLSANPSVEDLAKAGVFKDMTGAQTDQSERTRLAAGETPEIKVKMTDAGSDPAKQQADFLIKKDGSIELLNNPEKTGQKEIVVAVERDAGELKPSDTQQQALNQLMTYLDGRIKAQFPQAQEQGVKVDDQQNLVPDDLKNSLKVNSNAAPTNPELPDSANRQVQDMNRFRGSGEGSMSRQQANDYFPERSVPREANENDRIAAVKDTVASFVSRGDQHPYEHVVHRGSRGWGIGRYGLTYDMISSWLDNLDIGNLEQLEKEGKVPKGTAARMKAMKESMAKAKRSGKDSDLDPFLQKLKAGDKNNPITAADINQNFGKEVQELATSFNVGRFAQEMGGTTQNVDPGKLALAMTLGRVPGEQDLNDPANKQFVDAANQTYQIALNRYTKTGDTIPFTDASNLTDAMQKAEGKALWTDYAQATENGNLGCAIAASRILRAGGVPVGEQLGVDGLKNDMERLGARPTSLANAINSGRPYVIIKQNGGSHTGVAIGRTVFENSSSRGRVVRRDLSESSLRSGSVAYIVPSQYVNSNNA